MNKKKTVCIAVLLLVVICLVFFVGYRISVDGRHGHANTDNGTVPSITSEKLNNNDESAAKSEQTDTSNADEVVLNKTEDSSKENSGNRPGHSDNSSAEKENSKPNNESEKNSESSTVTVKGEDFSASDETNYNDNDAHVNSNAQTTQPGENVVGTLTPQNESSPSANPGNEDSYTVTERVEVEWNGNGWEWTGNEVADNHQDEQSSQPQNQNSSVSQETSQAAPHTHTYTSAVTTNPGCKTEGVMTYSCSCGNSYTESIPATGHSMGAEVDVDGNGMYYKQTCSACGAWVKRYAVTEQVEYWWRHWVDHEGNEHVQNFDDFDVMTEFGNQLAAERMNSSWGNDYRIVIVDWSYNYSSNY